MVFDSTQVPQARISMSAFRRIFLTLAFLLSSFAPGIWAQFPTTLYVSPNGSDSSGGSQFSPFATIQHAIDAAVPGSTVIVLEGRYQGPGNVDLDFEGKAITVQSRNPTDPTCVKATILDAAGIGAIARFVHDEGPSTVFAGFTVVLGDQTRVVAGIPGYLEFSRYAHPTTRSFRLEKPVAPKSLSVHAMSQPVFGMTNGTPTGGRAWDGHNPWFQPAPTTDYWGSGDLDGDGVVTSNDATLALAMVASPSTATAAADVNGDGVVDNADVALIDAAVGGQSLPAWWNQLTTSAQRRAWMDKIRTLEPTRNYTDPVWWFQCVQFSMQAQFHGSFYRNDLFGTYFGGGQTWFNIPLYAVDLGIGHAINAILVGDNPLVMTDWEFIEPQGQGAPEVIVTAANDGAYFPSGTIVNIFVPDKVQVGATQYSGGHAAVTFVMGDNATYTVSGHDPDLVMTRPAPPAPVAPDNRPDLWNPHILSAGAGMLLYERQRPDLTRADDIFLTDLPFADPPTGTSLVHDTQFTRLLDVARAPNLNVHLLWGGGAGYLPGLFHSVLNVNNRTLGSIDRITPSAAPTANDSREIRGGRILFTHDGAMHALWSTLKRSGSATYVNGVYWSKWNGSSWNAEQNVATSSIFADVAGNWHDDDDARFFFDAVADQSGGIVLVWASADNVGNLTLKWCRYDGSSWGAPSDIEAMGVAGGVSLARDAAGLIHLVYWQTGANPSYTSFGNLMHRTFDGTSWSNADTVDSGGYASTPHMVATSTALYLVWQRNTGTQRVPVWRRWANSTWSVDHILSVPAGADAYYPTADVLSDGRVAMTWSSRAADRVTIGTEYVGESNLNVSVAHSGDFTQGDSGDQYQITVSNVGQSSATGTLTISDTLPSGLSATNISGNGWSCSLLQLSCTRSDSLAASASYPAITVVVSVAANAAANVTNSVTMASTDEALLGTNSASDPTVVHPHVVAPQLSVSKTHTGDFVQGQQGAAYTIIVSNAAQAGTTSGVITVAETAPSGLALIGMSGTGWTCAYASCTRSDALSGGASYPSITATVNVANSASSPQVNSVAVSGGGSASANTTDSTNITIASPASTPSFSPAAGTYNIAQLVSINDATPNATIYYTTNGSTPTVSSTVYSGPITVSTSETIKAFATAGGYSPSNVETVVYTITPPAATPTFSVNPGIYATAQSVAISDATPGASIYFTTNGSTPTTNSTLYTSPIAVTGSETIKAIATAGGYSLSAVASASYTISSAVAVPTFSPAAGTYTTTQTVSIMDATPAATIYYTADGSTPTHNSTLYTGPISISSSVTLKAVATANGLEQSAMASAAYTIAPLSNLTYNLTRLDFGGQAVGTSSSAQTIIASNPNTTAIAITSIAASGDFVETSNCPSVPALGTCSINVTFSPAANGERNGTLTITNSLSNAPQSIGLTGRGTAPGIQVAPVSLNFGSQTVATTSAGQIVTIQNTGSASLAVSNIVTAGDFATSGNCGSIPAGSNCNLTVTFTPTASGMLTGSITITDNAAADNQSQIIALSGVGIQAGAAILPNSLTFPATVVGVTSFYLDTTLTNSGTASLTGITPSISGDFILTNNCPAALDAGKSCTLRVQYAPTIAGAESGSLTVSDSLGTQSVPLNGTGLTTGISLSATHLTFGGQRVNTASMAQTVILTNTGTATFKINSVESGNNFSQTTNCSGSLAPGASCSINVVFQPLTTGLLTAAITITDDTGAHVIGVQGQGISEGLIIVPSLGIFGAQEAGTISKAQTLIATNTGTVSLSLNPISVSSNFLEADNCPSVLQAGASCTISASFSPTATGTLSGSLVLSDASGAVSALAALNGQGTVPGLAASPSTLFFGSLPFGTTSDAQIVTVTNTGTAPLQIGDVKGSGDFTEIDTCASKTIAPGAHCVISVTMTPTTIGMRTGAIQINNSVDGVHAVALSGMGQQAGVNVSPTSLAFGSLPVTSANQVTSASGTVLTLAVANTGNVPLLLSSISTLGDFSETDNCRSAVAVNSSCTITVKFVPTALGHRTGTLTISDNAGGGTQLISLEGEGSPAGLTLTPPVVSFGTQAVGTTSQSRTTTLANNTGQSISNLVITASGEYSETNDCGNTLVNGASCTLNITVTPATSGVITGTITISSGGNSSPAVRFARPRVQAASSSAVSDIAVVALKASTRPSAIGLSSPTLAFDATGVGATSISQTVTLQNTGSAQALTGLVISASNGAEFPYTTNCQGTLQPQATCTITLSFTPAAAGSRVGMVNVTSDGGLFASVSLSGVGLPVVAAPIFSPAGGSFTSALTVTLSDATDGAAIYYTTDGTTPTTSSTRYSAPIAIPSTAILTAIATAGGYSNSAAVAATYTINIPANPVPVIGSLSPAFTAVGGPTFLLTVKGSGFTAGSTIYWGSTALVTQYVSATQITAQIAASAIAVAGTTAISVKTAAPGGGTSANLQFEADSAPSSATPPVFTSPAASITAGSTATYLVTLPSSATNVALNCLNLPTGASCSYSATDKSVSISTSSNTAKGTYQVTCVFTETEPGAAAGFLWRVLLIPAWFIKRRNGKRRINFFAYVPLVLVLAAVCAIGCGGGSGGGSAPVPPQPSPTHQVTSSGVVSLTIQ